MCQVDLKNSFTFDDLTGSLRDWLSSSPLLEATGRDALSPNAWRNDAMQMGGDSFTDVGVHLVDLALWLCDAPAKQVSAFRAEIGEPSAILSVTAQLSNDVQLSITYNDKVAAGESALSGQGQLTALGSAGTVTANWEGLMKAEASTARILAKGVDEAIEFEGETIEPAKAFVESILDGAPNFCTIEDGMQAVALVQSTYRAAAENQFVQVPAAP
jgi:predicted dehydrogenase